MAALPFAKLLGVRAVSDTLALLPWLRLEAHGVSTHRIRLLATLLALASATLFLVVPRRFAWVLPVLVLAYFAASQRVVENLTTGVSRAALFQGIRSVPRDWVERRIPKGADVAAIWTGRTPST